MFYADFREWNSVAAFEQYLDGITLFSGCRGEVEHHTWKPTLADWRGMATLEAIARYYRDTLGWDRGPHLFLTETKIYQMTPMTMRGIHATSANAWAIGKEHVWNGDAAPFSPAMLALSRGVTQALLRKMGQAGRALTVANAPGHREIPGTTKSCPGWKNDMIYVRKVLGPTVDQPAAPSTPGAEQPRRYRAKYKTFLRQGPAKSYAIAQEVNVGDVFEMDGIKFGEVVVGSDVWFHEAAGVGFGHESGFERML